MRKVRIAPGEYYHVFNRGVNKQMIFHDMRDFSRFLFLILYFQSPKVFTNLGRLIEDFVRHRVSHSIDQDVVRGRMVEIVSFCIMPNHFHLIVKEVSDEGIASYMQRILNAYGKYYNTKYEKSGHVFQGPYRAVHVENDDQLRYLSAYIHRNPREISKWFKKEDQYPWSSYSDVVKENRWGKLLVPEILMGEFKNVKDYDTFVKTSTAKLIQEEIQYLKDM
ncbi:transposase [Candidatus Parcubacteria bacterium]|nr:transposase [Candidatus Parcubacteria bacterium]